MARIYVYSACHKDSTKPIFSPAFPTIEYAIRMQITILESACISASYHRKTTDHVTCLCLYKSINNSSSSLSVTKPVTVKASNFFASISMPDSVKVARFQLNRPSLLQHSARAQLRAAERASYIRFCYSSKAGEKAKVVSAY